MKKPRVSRFVRKDKAMTDEELNKILEYVQWKPRDHALIAFLADTGSRAGGAAGLTWDLVDFEKYRATVTEKGHKTRTVFLGDLSVTKLLYWFEKQNRIHGNYVFSRNGQPINSPAISSVVRRASKQVGIRSLGAHSIRHRKGHQFSANRLSPKLCQIALGHVDVVTTINHYYEDDDSHVEAAMRELALPMTVEKPDNIVEFRKAK
jgi:integrase